LHFVGFVVFLPFFEQNIYEKDLVLFLRKKRNKHLCCKECIIIYLLTMGDQRWLIMPTIHACFSFKAWPVVAGGPTDALSKGKDE